MVHSPPKDKVQPKDKPWHQYRRETNWRLLEPGWAGQLEDNELEYVECKLKTDDALSYWWGFRPGQKTRSEAAIRRVAVSGDPEVRSVNVKLIRTRRSGGLSKSPSLAA